MSATINKQLNDIFEDVYHLFNDSIMVPEYLNRPEIERCVFEFMDIISSFEFLKYSIPFNLPINSHSSS